MVARHKLPFAISTIYCAVGVCVIWALSAIAPTSARAEGDRLALLIGNSRYEYATPLRNPENDVDLMAASLKTAGFRIFVGKNASHQVMMRLVEDFVRAAQAKRRPTLLVYFAGHGVQFDDVNYLIPVDARMENADALRRHAVNAASVLERLVAADPSLAMLILDACRDNPFENASRGLRRGLGDPGIQTGDGKRTSQLIAFATAPGTTADDGDSGNSPYTSALAESIISPGLSLEAVFRETRRKVVDRTQGQQQPWERASLFREFYFIPANARQKPGVDEVTFWDLASIVNSAEIYQRYLDRYPDGTFSELARRKIAAINTDFSYRRKAELFPILKLSKDMFPDCKDSNFHRFHDRVRDRLIELDGQIAYIALELPVRWLYCKRRPGRVSYEFLQFIRDAQGECGLFFFSADGIDTAKTACTASHRLNYASLIEHRRIFKDGGLIVGANSEASILIPGGRTDHHVFNFEYAEGHTDEMRAEFSGLVRVKAFKAEIYFTFVLDPVDPKRLGVSWKYDNTVAAAKARRDTDLGVPARRGISAAGAATARVDTGFSVLRNSAMSGHDLRHAKGTSEEACASQCQGESRCRAYLFDKWNRYCFLKRAVSEVRVDPKYNVGLKPGVTRPSRSARPRKIVYYRGKQFPDAGAFYPASDYRACARRCLSVKRCVAFTFDGRAGWAAPCKIMGSAGEYFSKVGVDSGVVRQVQ